MRDERVRALATTAGTLVGFGHLTSEAVSAVESLSARLGSPVRCLVEWNRVVLVDLDGRAHTTVHVRPEAINMARVNATLRAIDSLPSSGDIDDRELSRLNARLDEAAKISHAPLWLFVLACVAGAWGLALIYGARSPLSYVLIAVAAGSEACSAAGWAPTALPFPARRSRRLSSRDSLGAWPITWGLPPRRVWSRCAPP